MAPVAHAHGMVMSEYGIGSRDAAPQAQFMLQEPVRDASGKQGLLVMLNASALTAIAVHEQGLSTLAFIFGAKSGAPSGAFARQSDPPAHPLHLR